MTAKADDIALRRAVLVHWIVVPGCYLLLRLGGAGNLLWFDVLFLGALLGILWLTLLAYTRWVSLAIVIGMLVALDLLLSTAVLALTGGLSSDFYVLYGLVLLLVAAQLSSAWVLGVTLIMVLLSAGFLLWPGTTSFSNDLLRVVALILGGLVAWFYVRQRVMLPPVVESTEGQQLAWFQQINERVSPQTNPEELCEFAVVMARQLTDADIGNLLLLDEQDDAVGHLYISIGNESVRQSVLQLDFGSDGLCDQLIREGQPLAGHGRGLDVGTPSLLTYYPPIHSFVGVPFKSNHRVFGALFVANRHHGQAFTDADQVAVAFLGTQVGMALDNRRLLREVRERFTSTIESLVTAIEAKHPYTRGHSEQVTRYAVAIAQELHLKEEEIDKIRVAAVLHDVGKIGVPAQILDKASSLTERERDFIMSHPYIGAKIVEALDPRGEILYMIYYHHENYDGSGYPKGLKGDQIPLGAGIIRVADAFAAMTSDRPYQRMRTAVEALRELRAGAGRQFDPLLIRAFGGALRRLAAEEARRG